MSESAAWVLVALAALLVGAAIPALIQLRKTLKVAEETLQSTDRQLKEALDRLSATLERVNRAVDGLEHGLGKVSSLLEAIGGIGDALGKVKSSVGLVASLGSALGAGLLAALRPQAARRRRRTQPG